MDLNILVLCGRLVEDPTIYKHTHSELNRLELVVETSTAGYAGVQIVTHNRVFWSGVTNDELLTNHLEKGRRVWVAGYVVSQGREQENTDIVALSVQTQGEGGEFDE